MKQSCEIGYCTSTALPSNLLIYNGDPYGNRTRITGTVVFSGGRYYGFLDIAELVQ